MRVASLGHAAYAAVMIALGLQGLIHGQFTAVWGPVPKSTPVLLAYLCGAVSLAGGIGLLWDRTAGSAARLLLACLLLWILVFRVPAIVRGPGQFGAWDGCAETVVMTAGAWVLYGWFGASWDREHLGVAAGDRGIRIARTLYGLAMIPFGMAHFIYPTDTANLVPHWLPGHLVLTYLTGSAFLAAGAAILTNIMAPLAAALSALQIGLFTLLVWVPIIAAGAKSAFVWSEFGISTALTAAAWVVADSYRRTSTGADRRRI